MANLKSNKKDEPITIINLDDTEDSIGCEESSGNQSCIKIIDNLTGDVSIITTTESTSSSSSNVKPKTEMMKSTVSERKPHVAPARIYRNMASLRQSLAPQRVTYQKRFRIPKSLVEVQLCRRCRVDFGDREERDRHEEVCLFDRFPRRRRLKCDPAPPPDLKSFLQSLKLSESKQTEIDSYGVRIASSLSSTNLQQDVNILDMNAVDSDSGLEFITSDKVILVDENSNGSGTSNDKCETVAQTEGSNVAIMHHNYSLLKQSEDKSKDELVSENVELTEPIQSPHMLRPRLLSRCDISASRAANHDDDDDDDDAVNTEEDTKSGSPVSYKLLAPTSKSLLGIDLSSPLGVQIHKYTVAQLEAHKKNTSPSATKVKSETSLGPSDKLKSNSASVPNLCKLEFDENDKNALSKEEPCRSAVTSDADCVKSFSSSDVKQCNLYSDTENVECGILSDANSITCKNEAESDVKDSTTNLIKACDNVSSINNTLRDCLPATSVNFSQTDMPASDYYVTENVLDSDRDINDVKIEESVGTEESVGGSINLEFENAESCQGNIELEGCEETTESSVKMDIEYVTISGYVRSAEDADVKTCIDASERAEFSYEATSAAGECDKNSNKKDSALSHDSDLNSHAEVVNDSLSVDTDTWTPPEYEQYCNRTGRTTAGSPSFPVVYRKRYNRSCTMNNVNTSNAVNPAGYYHTYKFTRMDRRRFCRAVERGLDWGSYQLKKSLSPCAVSLKPLTDEEVSEWNKRCKKLRIEQQRLHISHPGKSTLLGMRHDKGLTRSSHSNYHIRNKANDNVRAVGMKNGGCSTRGGYSNRGGYSTRGRKISTMKWSEFVQTTRARRPNNETDIRVDGKHGKKRRTDDVIAISSSDEEREDTMSKGKKSSSGNTSVRNSSALLFRCHVCHAEITCKASAPETIQHHYEQDHKIFNIEIVQQTGKNGEMVLSIVQSSKSKSSTTTAAAAAAAGLSAKGKPATVTSTASKTNHTVSSAARNIRPNNSHINTKPIVIAPISDDSLSSNNRSLLLARQSLSNQLAAHNPSTNPGVRKLAGSSLTTSLSNLATAFVNAQKKTATSPSKEAQKPRPKPTILARKMASAPIVTTQAMMSTPQPLVVTPITLVQASPATNTILITRNPANQLPVTCGDKKAVDLEIICLD